MINDDAILIGVLDLPERVSLRAVRLLESGK